jgi:hypothetical protein
MKQIYTQSLTFRTYRFDDQELSQGPIARVRGMWGTRLHTRVTTSMVFHNMIPKPLIVHRYSHTFPISSISIAAERWRAHRLKRSIPTAFSTDFQHTSLAARKSP